MTKAIDELVALLNEANLQVTFYGSIIDPDALNSMVVLVAARRLMPPLTVDRAAIRCMGLVFSVPRPGRHDAVIQAMIEEFGRDMWKPCFCRHQGFVLSDGSYATRREALRVAWEADQLLPHARHRNSSILTSECVW